MEIGNHINITTIHSLGTEVGFWSSEDFKRGIIVSYCFSSHTYTIKCGIFVIDGINNKDIWLVRTNGEDKEDELIKNTEEENHNTKNSMRNSMTDCIKEKIEAENNVSAINAEEASQAEEIRNIMSGAILEILEDVSDMEWEMIDKLIFSWKLKYSCNRGDYSDKEFESIDKMRYRLFSLKSGMEVLKRTMEIIKKYEL